MNMLMNRIPFGLLSNDEMNNYSGVNTDSLLVYRGNRWDNKEQSHYSEESVYRLKLKEGEWYKIEWMNHIFILKCVDSKGGDFIEECFAIPKVVYDWQYSESMMRDCDVFCLATQEEIDSVKPKDEGFVDVEIEWPCGSIAFSEWGNGDITSSTIGHTMNGWALSGYSYRGVAFDDKPINFEEDGKTIQSKATHARFVRVK